MNEIAAGLGATAGIFLFLAIVVGIAATNSGISYKKEQDRTRLGWIILGIAVVFGLSAVWTAVLG